MTNKKFDYIGYMKDKDYIRYNEYVGPVLMDTPSIKDMLEDVNKASNESLSKFTFQSVLEKNRVVFPTQLVKCNLREALDRLAREPEREPLSFKKFLISWDMILPYATEGSKESKSHQKKSAHETYNSPETIWCLVVPFDKAYDKWYEKGHSSDKTESYFHKLLASNNIVIINRFENAWSKARKAGKYPLNYSLKIKALADSLDVSYDRISSDSIGETINGKNGSIYIDKDNHMNVTIEVETKRKWSAIIKKFEFMQKVSTREEKSFIGETKAFIGTFKLDRHPDTSEAIVIRKELGLKKKPTQETDKLVPSDPPFGKVV